MLPAQWDSVIRPVIGMLHLPPLAGAPLFGGSMAKVRELVFADARALADGGAHGLMIENFGDVPFYPARVPSHVITQMTALAAEVKRNHPHLPLGINVLRNDGLGALSIAHAVGAEFIRVNVLCGARLADQGILHGIAHDLLRLRHELGAEHVKIFADVDVKHSAPLAQRPLADEVDDMIERGLADALIVSGAGTGKSTDPEKLRQVKGAAGHTPVLVGSGVTPMSLPDLWPQADGFIVGTYLKYDSNPLKPVDPARVCELIRSLPT